jgi:uncharacterized cofD-like protein
MSITKQNLRITLIGGGTGSFTLLQELKKLTPNISAIVNMSDDGGSTGWLRDELGVLPPGDIRQCLVALSDTPEVRDLFNFRFNKGLLRGQSAGNIILSALELQRGSFAEAVEVASRILHITGRVIPTSLEKHNLLMRDGNKIIKGEYKIAHRRLKHPDATVELDPPSRINPEAARAIVNCDLLVIAPGNLYGSLLPTLGAQGIRKAFNTSKATKVMISNLVTKPGQTDSWHVVDYVKKIEQSIGVDQLHYVLYNNHPPSDDLLAKYAAEGEFPVSCGDTRFNEISAKAVGAPLLANKAFKKSRDDTLIPRTLIRHDAEAVCAQLQKILDS